MAAQFEKRFVQDLTQDIKIRQCGTIVFNADNESNIISVDLYNGSEEYSGGGTVTGACICPDGSTVPLTGSISGKTASVVLSGDCFAFPGQIGIGVQVTSGTVKTTVLKAIYNVELFETDTVIDPGSRITMSVADLIQEINDALADIPASDTNLKAAMAPVFSTSTAYQAGQYVWYEGQLYQFNADHAAGTWTGTDAGLAAIGDDVADLKSAITDSGLLKLSSINILGYDVEQKAIGTSNKWSNNGSSVFIPTSEFLSGYKTISITANDEQVAVVCFLKTNDTTVNPSYATGTSRTVIQAGVTQEFSIPDDCNYINILYIWADNFLPKDVKWYTSAIPEISAALPMDRDEIGLTVDAWLDHTAIISTSYATAGNVQGTTSYNNTSVLKASGFVPLRGKMLELPLVWAIDTTFQNYGMSLYDKDFQPIMGRAISAFPLRGESDPHIVWVHVYIPENAKYFRTSYWMEVSEDKPEFTYNLLKEIPDEYKPITHELPVDTYMQNAIRRARQLTDIKWTPRVNIPRYSMIYGSTEHFLDWFYADHEYTGIPYSGAGDDETHWSTIKDWGYTHNWVGQHIPIESFVTAARYQNSIMGEKASQSVASYDSSPYGDVCTALVNYAVNGPVPLRGITNFFRDSSQKNVYRTDNKTIADSDMNDVFIGDFLYTQEHVIIITDILRDKDGNVTYVEMSEETTVGNGNNTILGTRFGGVARRKMWDIDEFQQRYGSYIKFRRTTFYGIPYTRSKYVNTGNEGDMETIVDMPLIPYLGEGAIYKVGYVHNSKICIGVSGFTTLVVLKDGEEFGTFDVTGLTEISAGFSAEGSYEAYLTKAGNVRTLSCHWTVVV